jgi:hypothetical protein
MNKQLSRIFLWTLLVSAVAACKKEGTVPDLGYGYFPDQVGKYVIYDVDSFYYDDFTGLIDTSKFQLKEKIESVYQDNQGRPTLRLERSVRFYNPLIPYASIPWTLRDVWAANRTNTTAEKVEENVRYIKLAFPVKEGQVWNGNAQNTGPEQKYTYYFYDQARIIGGRLFDSVLQVNQHDQVDLIQKKLYVEKYAKNTGLVYKHVIDVSSQPPPEWNGTPFEVDSLQAFYAIDILNRVTSGVQYTMTVNSFGTE